MRSQRPHIVTLSFDDGFRKSFLRIAGIFESFGFSACFNVIAAAHLPDNQVHDDYMKKDEFGDFGLWNELQARGHEVMPHGYNHEDLREMPFEVARDSILRCLDVFTRELRGFDSREAVFNFPYNRTSPELEEWLPSLVMGFRGSGGGINPLPLPSTTKITTDGMGPGNCEWHLDAALAGFLSGPAGWMVYNLHGLEDEGWGPVRAEYLERLLGRLRETESVRIVPAARVLRQARGRIVNK